jgi:hypothetical protein
MVISAALSFSGEQYSDIPFSLLVDRPSNPALGDLHFAN